MPKEIYSLLNLDLRSIRAEQNSFRGVDVPEDVQHEALERRRIVGLADYVHLPIEEKIIFVHLIDVLIGERDGDFHSHALQIGCAVEKELAE
jgi:hypothetical protein